MGGEEEEEALAFGGRPTPRTPRRGGQQQPRGSSRSRETPGLRQAVSGMGASLGRLSMGAWSASSGGEREARSAGKEQLREAAKKLAGEAGAGMEKAAKGAKEALSSMDSRVDRTLDKLDGLASSVVGKLGRAPASALARFSGGAQQPQPPPTDLLG